MKVVKYYCDICNKEVKGDSELYAVDCINDSWNSFVELSRCSHLERKDICVECLEKMTKFLKNLKNESIGE